MRDLVNNVCTWLNWIEHRFSSSGVAGSNPAVQATQQNPVAYRSIAPTLSLTATANCPALVVGRLYPVLAGNPATSLSITPARMRCRCGRAFLAGCRG